MREYVCSGELAVTLSQLDALTRAEADAQRNEARKISDTLKTATDAVRAFWGDVDALLQPSLEAAGCYKHHGQWRRRRHGKA